MILHECLISHSKHNECTFIVYHIYIHVMVSYKAKLQAYLRYLRYVGFIQLVCHVLHLLPIRFTK